jgi:hypothetical protein
MTLSRTHIALLIGLAMVIITVNAAYRVRYFGQVEAQQQAEARQRAEAAARDGGVD